MFIENKITDECTLRKSHEIHWTLVKWLDRLGFTPSSGHERLYRKVASYLLRQDAFEIHPGPAHGRPKNEISIAAHHNSHEEVHGMVIFVHRFLLFLLHDFRTRKPLLSPRATIWHQRMSEHGFAQSERRNPRHIYEILLAIPNSA